MGIKAVEAIIDLIEIGAVVGNDNIVKCLRNALNEQSTEEIKAGRQAIAEAEQQNPVGRVIAASLEYSTVQWLNQTSEIGGGDPKNSRSWPITGDAVYTHPQPRKE